MQILFGIIMIVAAVGISIYIFKPALLKKLLFVK